MDLNTYLRFSIIICALKPADLLQFIARCLSMDEIPAAREGVVKVISSGNVPWEGFVWKTSSHYVMPAVYAIFRRNGLLHLLPPDLEVHMERIYSLNAERNLLITDQCREINALLTHNGAEPLFFKGSGLILSGLYRDPAERMMEDIDVLIREGDRQKAFALLESAGYRTAEGYGEEVYTGHHHLPPLIHPKKRATVELHLLPFPRNYLPLSDPESIFSRSVQTGQGNLRVPSAADNLLICFAHEHRAARGYLSRISSLKGMYDFFLLTGKSTDTPGHVTEGVFRKDYPEFDFLVRRFFGMDIPNRGVYPEIRERVWKRELLLLNHPVWDRLWNKIIYRISLLGKAGMPAFFKAYYRRKMRGRGGDQAT